MQRIAVESSNLKSIGYDDESEVLEIEFNSGGVYQYFAVPNTIYHGLMNAESHGKYFDVNIKKQGYKYKKIS